MKTNEKKCPRCAEIIKKEARVCKHCGYEYSVAEIDAEKAQDAKNQRNGAIGCAGILVILLLVGMCSSREEQAPTGNVTDAIVSPEAAKALEERNGATIATKLKQARKLPASDIDANARAYEELVTLAPANAAFISKRDEYRALVEKAARFDEHPEEALEITKFNWEKSGFGSIQLVRFTVRNSAPFAIRDFTLECNHQGPSGTDMDSNTRVIYELVPANRSRRVSEINMGFINSQVVTSRCSITDAKKAE